MGAALTKDKPWQGWRVGVRVGRDSEGRQVTVSQASPLPKMT